MLRTHWDELQRSEADFNRSQRWLDLRQRFDLYLARDGYLLKEAGETIKRGEIPVPLRFDRFRVYVTHMMYHSDLERQELPVHHPELEYFIKRTPYYDERHWDNLALGPLTRMPE